MASAIGASTKKDRDKYECAICGLLSTKKSGVIAQVNEYHLEEKDTYSSDNMASQPWPSRQRFSGNHPEEEAVYQKTVHPNNTAGAKKTAVTRAIRKGERLLQLALQFPSPTTLQMPLMSLPAPPTSAWQTVSLPSHRFSRSHIKSHKLHCQESQPARLHS